MVNHHFSTPYLENIYIYMYIYLFFQPHYLRLHICDLTSKKDTACNLRQILEKVRDSRMDFKDENWTKIDVAIRLLWDSRVFSSYSMLEKVETAVFSPVNQWVAPWKICEDTKLWYLFHKHSRVIFQRGRRRNWRIFDSKILGFQLMWIHVEMNCWCDWILEIRGLLHVHSEDTVDGQKSGDRSWNPIILQGFTHPFGGCLGFLNHQQYHQVF